jgi:hypothetical protein
MPTTSYLPIKQLALDLTNFRTVPQKNEIDAVHAMISINPDWFWALLESLLEDGYHPTENIIVLKEEKNGRFVVKEGNRRIGALKLIYGYIKIDGSLLPSQLAQKIAGTVRSWKVANKEVPCAVYEQDEADIVDRIVTRTHGKGERAGRDAWGSVAKARHSRNMNGASEPALDLLEMYLREGKNVNDQQRERWSGNYPLSVLDEAIKRLAPRFGATSSRDLSDQYPKKIKFRNAIEDILSDIGLEILSFKMLRDERDDFAEKYGIPVLAKPSAPNTPAARAGNASGATTTAAGGPGGKGGSGPGQVGVGKKTRAVATDDPKSVKRALRAFSPVGKNREKLVTLQKEAKALTLSKHPHAFCFLLRSMFEISAKAYCQDHAAQGGPSHSKATGEDRALVDVLRDISSHLINNSLDKQMIKVLHGAMAELAKKEGILSVTSLNQLIHNPKFTVDEAHISTVFGNIFPLLEEMNR